MTAAQAIKDSGSPRSGGSEPLPKAVMMSGNPAETVSAGRLLVGPERRVTRVGSVSRRARTRNHVEHRPRVTPLCATRALKQNRLTSLKKITTQKEI